MQKSDTRRFLEEQFAKYEQAEAEANDKPFAPAAEIEEGAADEYLLAPSAYQKEFGEIFKTLPFALRRYMHKRENEAAAAFSRLNEELSMKHFLDAAFAEKGCRHGFKTAKEWLEKLIFAEEMLDSNPEYTLRFLARAYGLPSVLAEKADKGVELCELKIGLLSRELQRLNERVAAGERRYAAAAEDAAAVRKAKEAGFSPKGKAPLAEDLSKLTTRQILERKFAELED